MVEPESSDRQAVVLVADSHEWLSRSLESVLGPIGCTVLRVSDGATLLRRVSEIAPDVVIADADLSDMDAAGVCAGLRAQSRGGSILPIVVVSATPLKRQDRLEVFKAGAWAVLSFPLEPEGFVAMINNFIAAKAEADAAGASALLDRNTGLYNARGVLRRLHELAADATRSQRALACVIISVSGDGTQDRVGQVLRASVRASDTVGRISDAEFVVLAPGTGPDGARQMARRLASLLSTIRGRRGAAARIHVGGFAVQDMAREAIEPTEMLVRAASSLRQAQTAHVQDAIRFYDELPVLDR